MSKKKSSLPNIKIPRRYVVAEMRRYGREAYTLSEIFNTREEAQNFFSKVHRHFEMEVVLFEEILQR